MALMQAPGVGVDLFGDVGSQDGCRQAPMDGFTATPNRSTPTPDAYPTTVTSQPQPP